MQRIQATSSGNSLHQLVEGICNFLKCTFFVLENYAPDLRNFPVNICVEFSGFPKISADL